MYSEEEEIYIEPDAGQQAILEVDNPENFFYLSHKQQDPVFIGNSRAIILKCQQLENLEYVAGHRA